jgi:hypothetical protein
MRAAWKAVLFAALGAPGCELQEVTTAEGADILVAEIVLRSGESVQTAVLQRTGAPPGTQPVSGVSIEVYASDGATMRFVPAPLQRCIDSPEVRDIRHSVACYIAERDNAIPILSGASYSLRIATDDGRVLTGSTTLPSELRLRRPAAESCRLAPDTPLTMSWGVATGAWAYLTEALFVGLKDAMAERGLTVSEEPLRLAGVSVSAADTSITFPGGLGVFNRFEEEIAPVLVALQRGMPPGVNTRVTVGAADRNLVNWIRGGNFNPSGPVRVGSIRGDGIGVFGSLTMQRVSISTEIGALLPEC